jgi:hypothetical protein
MNTEDKMKVVIQEIMQDKIYLDTEMNVRVRGEQAGGGPADLDFSQL